METHAIALPGETIQLTTQLGFGTDVDKWVEDEKSWHYDNSVQIIRRLRQHTARNIVLLGLELWWVKIHLKPEFRQWGQFLEDVRMHRSAASRYKQFALAYMMQQGIVGEGSKKVNDKDIVRASKKVTSDVATLQQIDMREFWGTKSSVVTSGSIESRSILGFSFGKVFRQIWQHWHEWSDEERSSVVDTLKLWMDMFQGLINDLEYRGQPMLPEEQRARVIKLLKEKNDPSAEKLIAAIEGERINHRQ